ncbi:signal transduction histidine kinase [Saccharomonospora glauca K62]|uniref:histidine kinase n=1 Tax=Saccharomonospora glauca K62 TaxID=928724 RepID=I1CWG7_9PSEU|nr:signal transduction histidine kinase [Saccharomonospora glauca K62]
MTGEGRSILRPETSDDMGERVARTRAPRPVDLARVSARSSFIDHHGRSWWVAEGLTLLLFGWALVEILVSGPPLWLGVTLVGAFACWVAFVVLSPRRPRAAATALALCSLLASAAEMAGEFAVFVVAAMALAVYASHPAPSTRTIMAVGVADLGLTTVSGLVADADIATLVSTSLVVVVVLLIGINRRQYQLRARQTELLLEQTRLARSEHARAAALDERTRIARELHDVLAHSLGALRVQLEVAEAELEASKDPDSVLRRLRRCRALATDGLIEAREAVSALRRDVPALGEAIAELVDAFERDHEVPVTFRRSGRARPLPSAATVALLGAVREALTNAAKHARGAPVTVTLDHTDTAVRVVVHNTTDTPVTRGTGFGLTGMAERLALCGGTLTAGPDTDGWSVTATVPTRLADESPKEAVSG